MSDPTNIDIRIKTTAETGGAEDAAREIDRVKTATSEATTASVAQDRASKQGAASFGQLQQAARGGAGGILQVRQAVQGLTAAFLANPITGAIAAFFLLRGAAGRLGDALGGLIARGRSTADSITGVGDRVKQTAAQIARIREAGDTALTKIAADAKIAADDIERFSKGIDEAKRRLNSLADAATEAKLAALDLAEAEALSGAGSEVERETIRQDFQGQRTAVRRQSGDAARDRERRFEEERRAEAQGQVSGASGRIGDAQARADVARRTLDARVAANQGLDASTPEGRAAVAQTGLARRESEEADRALAAVRAANEPIIARAQAEAQKAAVALDVLDKKTSAASSTARAEDITRAPAQAAALDTARAADARAATLAQIGGGAATLEFGVNALAGTVQAQNPAVAEAARAAREAARAAQEGGTTDSEAALLLETFNDLFRVLEANNARSTGLEATLKELQSQIKTLRTR